MFSVGFSLSAFQCLISCVLGNGACNLITRGTEEEEVDERAPSYTPCCVQVAEGRFLLSVGWGNVLYCTAFDGQQAQGSVGSLGSL
jgi:hypothetical protein